jgi:hypothetical protein
MPTHRRALSRGLGVQYKTAFVLAHKIREAMGTARKRERIGGANRIAEAGGAYSGGHIRPENRKAGRKDRRLSGNRNDKRQCVVLICERPAKSSSSEAIGHHKAGAETGRTLATVVASEDGAMLADRGQTSAAMGFIKARLDRATTVHADEASGWNELHVHPRFHGDKLRHQARQPLRRICER